MRKPPAVLLSGFLGMALTVSIVFPVFAATSSNSDSAQLENQTEAFGEPEKRQHINRLFEMLGKAKNEKTAREVENEIWQSWMALPSDLDLREMMNEAMSARRSYNFERAISLLDHVVKRAPQYSEGWNQRAFVLFLQEKFEASLNDLDKALALEPRHFGALAGKARIFIFQGRFEKGQALLKEAVEIHPFLRERSMIVEPKKLDL